MSVVTTETAHAGVMGALAIFLGWTHLGFIPWLAGAALTIIHVPVIIGAVLEGPVVGTAIGLIFALEAVCLLLALALGRLLFVRAAARMDTKRSLMLALIVYTAITIWGFFLDSVVEFWCLAWLVACVQGGSQALSRSLFSTMIPAPKSGEYFGLFGVMEKVATILGPLVFAAAGTLFGSSRPAVLSLIVFFIVGMLLLARVDVEAGRRLAREEEARLGSLQK